MSKNSIWMPLYIGDYLADTQLLTTEQHGAYFLLIMAYWKNQGPLPDDDEVLSALCKLTPAKWKKVKAALRQYFTAEDGKIIHNRIEKEFAAQLTRKEKAEQAAKKKWAAEEEKAGKKGGGKSPKKSDSNDAQSMLGGCSDVCSDDAQRYASHNHSHNQVKNLPVPEQNYSENPVDFTTGEVLQWRSGL